MSRIHMVTYATPAFRLRRWLLLRSARRQLCVSKSHQWTPARLVKSGFPPEGSGVSLGERGGGFWSWKPYIISQTLNEIPDGEFVLYCDTGRGYPWLSIDAPLDPLIEWLDDRGQDVLPGVEIPWHGSMIKWTKRGAFHKLEMDTAEYWNASPIQASFSLWRNTDGAKDFAQEWLALCKNRTLISDDAGDLTEYSEFVDHRHDQSLLTLACLKMGIKGVEIESKGTMIQEKNPAFVAKLISRKPLPLLKQPHGQKSLIKILSALERRVRR